MLTMDRSERFGMEMVNLANLEGVYIRQLIYEGKIDEAFQEIVKLFKFGHMTRNSNITIINFISATTVKSNAMNLLQYLALESNLQSGSYKAIIDYIEQYNDSRALKRSFKVEYAVWKNMLLNFKEVALDEKLKEYSDTPLNRYLLNENLTISEIGGYIEEGIRNIDKPFNAADHTWKMYHPSNAKAIQYLSTYSGNVLGKQFFGNIAEMLDDIYRLEYIKNAKFNLIKLLLALKAYHADRQTLPESLNELVPDYIDEIPVDPFDFRKLRYSKKDKVIYSIGPDLKEEKREDEDSLFVELKFE
jgi:hypothetical protein